MPKSHTAHPPEVWRQMVDLVHAGRTPEELSRGHCQVFGPRGAFGCATRPSSPSCCHLDARLLPPHPEGFGAGAAVPGGGH